jgi:hypothetical protein
MRHGIGKGTLQHGSRRDALKLRFQFKMPAPHFPTVWEQRQDVFREIAAWLAKYNP